MSAVTQFEYIPDLGLGSPARPDLQLVPDAGIDLADVLSAGMLPVSIMMQEAAFESRTAAEQSPGANGEEQAAVQTSVGDWLRANLPSIFGLGDDGKQVPGTAAEYTRVLDDPRDTLVSILTDYLEVHHGDAISPAELQATRDFLNASFAIQADVDNSVDLSQGNKNERAFVVPVRLSRDNSYADELRLYIPALRYVPDELVSTFVRDLPPFIMDNYKGGGQIIVSPSSTDIATDLGRVPSLSIYRDRVNTAIRWAKAFGAKDIGLGATLPGVMRYGKAIEGAEDIISTTGHGGTMALVSMMIERAIAKVPPEDRHKIRLGAIGLGAIGLPGAEVGAELFPDLVMNVTDVLEDPRKKAARNSRFNVLASAQEVVDNSDIIISTATTTFTLDPAERLLKNGDPNPNFIEASSLDGKTILDDSEPRSFLREQVIALDGVVLDVVGRSNMNELFALARETDSGYGHTLNEGWLDEFGCGLELAVLNHIRKTMVARGDSEEKITGVLKEYAVQGPLTVAIVRSWISLFKNFGVGPAPEQSAGILYAEAA